MRKINPYARILLSVVLIALLVYLVQQRRARTAASSSEPFPAGSPSAEAHERFTWIPSYPGAALANIHSRRTRTESNYGYEFGAKAELKQVASFYEDRLRASGFTVNTQPKADSEIDLHAESPDRKRQLDVTLTKAPDMTVVSLAALER